MSVRPSAAPPARPSRPPKGWRALVPNDWEQQARQSVWDDVWRDRKLHVMGLVLADIIATVRRALGHVLLWVPAIVLWPMLLSANGITKGALADWMDRVGGGGWNGDIWKLAGAVFVVSITAQALQGALGARVRNRLDRLMERSVIGHLVAAVLPLSPRPLSEGRPVDPPIADPMGVAVLDPNRPVAAPPASLEPVPAVVVSAPPEVV